MKKFAIVIPAYNEEASIARVVREVLAVNLTHGVVQTVVVVNDCSTDATANIAKTLDCVLLDLPCNLGIGGAVQTGLKYACENGFDYAMQLDGDGQHPANQINKFISRVVENDDDVVIGSRYIEKRGFQSSVQRRMGITYLKHLIKLLTGMKITDSTSGFRLLNRRALDVVKNKYPDEYPEPEALILFHKHKLKVVEIPVEMEHRSGGQSSIRYFKSLYYMAKVSLTIVFSYLKKTNL